MACSFWQMAVGVWHPTPTPLPSDLTREGHCWGQKRLSESWLACRRCWSCGGFWDCSGERLEPPRPRELSRDTLPVGRLGLVSQSVSQSISGGRQEGFLEQPSRESLSQKSSITLLSPGTESPWVSQILLGFVFFLVYLFGSELWIDLEIWRRVIQSLWPARVVMKMMIMVIAVKVED